MRVGLIICLSSPSNLLPPPPPQVYADHKHSSGYSGVHKVWGLKGYLDMVTNTLPRDDIPGSTVIRDMRDSLEFVSRGVERQIERGGNLGAEGEWRRFLLGKGEVNIGVAPPNLWNGVFSNNDPLQILWSGSCPTPTNGYTCGVWFLNHITSLGGEHVGVSDEVICEVIFPIFPVSNPPLPQSPSATGPGSRARNTTPTPEGWWAASSLRR